MFNDPDPYGAPDFIETADGARLAYHHHPASGDGLGQPGVVFLGGYMSDMTGAKALWLHRWAEASGRAFLRLDYRGHGRSSGRFEDGTIGRWAADALAVIEAVTEGPQVLVGSSMGGWIMLLAATRLVDAYPARVAGLVGIAAAPDFTEDLMWGRFDRTVRETLLREGLWVRPSVYGPDGQPVTLKLIEDGRRHLMLRDPIGLCCPVHLLHGMVDDAVPWQTSVRIADRLMSDSVTVELIKDGDHRLSRDADLDRLVARVGTFV